MNEARTARYHLLARLGVLIVVCMAACMLIAGKAWAAPEVQSGDSAVVASTDAASTRDEGAKAGTAKDGVSEPASSADQESASSGVAAPSATSPTNSASEQEAPAAGEAEGAHDADAEKPVASDASKPGEEAGQEIAEQAGESSPAKGAASGDTSKQASAEKESGSPVGEEAKGEAQSPANDGTAPGDASHAPASDDPATATGSKSSEVAEPEGGSTDAGASSDAGEPKGATAGKDDEAEATAVSEGGAAAAPESQDASDDPKASTDKGSKGNAATDGSASSETTPDKEKTQEPEPPSTLVEGTYVIKPLVAGGRALDVEGGSLDEGGRISQYAVNGTYAQMFYVQPSSDGTYSVFSVRSGLALDATGGLLHQASYTGTKEQRFSLSPNSDGTWSLFVGNDGKALAVQDGKSANGASIVVASASTSKSQRFKFVETNLVIPGVHVFDTAGDVDAVIGVESGSAGSNVPVRQESYDASLSEKDTVARTDEGYTVKPLHSSGYVAAKDARVVQDVSQFTWDIDFTTASRGGMTLVDPSTGLAATTQGSVQHQAPLKMESRRAVASQGLLPKHVRVLDDGTYNLVNARAGNNLEVADGSWMDGANVQVQKGDNSGAQTFDIAHVESGFYKLVNAMTGKSLTVDGSSAGANVIQEPYGTSDSQLWHVDVTNGYLVFRNKATGAVLAAAGDGGRTANVQVAYRNNAPTQLWSPVRTSYQPDAALQRAIDSVASVSSATSYAITVDCTNHRTVVFERSSGGWTPIQNWLVSTGAPESPTVLGDYTVGIKGYSFGEDGYTCYYYTQFWGDYLFHSVLYDAGTFTVQDGRLGMSISHGCVRMKIEDAKWIWDNIPAGTAVRVYE